MKILSVQNLSVYNGTTTILDKVSFELFKNEIVCLVGESGSGKSMTLKAILGILPSHDLSMTAETLTVHGIDLLNISKDTIRSVRSNHISFVPQSAQSSLHPLRSIEKQLLEMGKHLRPRALELLRTVGFSNPEQLLKERPHQLSGGMKQRALIAMALIQNPSLILLDEPTTALDVTLQKEVLELLLSLKHQFALSMLFVTHDLGVVAKIADRVLVMKQGQIVEQGSVHDVLLTPTHEYTKELVDSCVL